MNEFDKIIKEVKAMSEEEIDKYLEDNGIDVEEHIKEMRKLLFNTEIKL